MPTGSPKLESQTSTDLSNIVPRTTSSGLTNAESSQTTDTISSHTIKIPSELQQYITTTSRPNEIYSRLHESREKRLRLLLRRFTNQIQYGCKNPFCTVQTCLSYRRRHSQVPLRPYTDVTARALAWRCVEEYTNSTSKADTDKLHYGANGRRIKQKVTPCERGAGLCWNEPVVPWYADVGGYLKRRKQLQQNDRGGLNQDDHPQDEARVGAVLSRAQKLAPLDVADVPDAQRNGHVVAGIPAPEATFQGLLKPVLDLRHEHKDTKHNIPTVSQFEVRLDESDPSPDQAVEPPKDTASFSQMLYDTSAVKSLDHFQKIKLNRRHMRPPCSAASSNTATAPFDHIPKPSNQEPAKDSINSNDSMPTFKILNKHVLDWLVASVSYPDDVISIETETADNRMDVITFAQQSLHYCLSHPLRLLKSAEQWRSSANLEQEEMQENQATNVHQQRERTLQSPALTPTDRVSTYNSLPLLPDLHDVSITIDDLSQVRPYHEVLDHIFAALQHAYIPPPPAATSKKDTVINLGARQVITADDKNHIRRASRDSVAQPPPTSNFLDDRQVASMCILSLLSLVNCCSRFATKFDLPFNVELFNSTEFHYVWCRETGHAFPQAYLAGEFDRRRYPEWQSIYDAILVRIDANDDMRVFRVLESTANVISHRLALHNTMKTIRENRTRQNTNIVDLIVGYLCGSDRSDLPSTVLAPWCFLDLMSIVLVKKWNRKPVIERTSPVGGALQLLAGLYRNRAKLNLRAHHFDFKFVAEALDATKMPLEWLAFRENPKQLHILSFSFLFDSANLVKYFRAINIQIMRKSYEYASINHAYARHFFMRSGIPMYGGKEVLEVLRPHMARYFVLTVRRQNMLEDAIDQIWRREHQELMRPLKVSLGKNEGEDGLDHGGVQQEFFRVVFACALNQDYGMFAIDDKTQMTWFQPGSLEPLYKFEALGVLMSLAVYNSVTLPITFPLAFYRKLLGLKVKHLEHIEDGWPDLSQGLRVLQDWSEGDVGDVIARTYEFTFQAFGQPVSVDMSRVGRLDAWPTTKRPKPRDKAKHAQPACPDDLSSESRPEESTARSTSENNSSLDDEASTVPEAPLVTNANRAQYIKDYIFWLTDKSIAPQFEAFSKGFHTCLDRTALSIFTPEALKTVVEGHTTINIDELQACTTYDSFNSTDETIVDFWDVVRNMSETQHKQLLEFVTASDRVPVNGISSITFIIQKNGEGDDRLPSSSTCYGRLLLPQYSSKSILQAKLEKAIENSVGFGSL